MKPKILISACLMGQPVRYDGNSNEAKVSACAQQLSQWQQQQRLVPVCPEILGGLPTPRPAAEIHQQRVITRQGQDVTAAFIAGAEKTVAIARQQGVTAALLAARSPSCGSDGIYNGEFTGTLIAGMGITVQQLEQAGVRCFSPENFDQLCAYIQQREHTSQQQEHTSPQPDQQP